MRVRSRSASSFIVALFLTLFFTSLASAQLTEGTIDGTVTDASGAGVPGAKVRIQNTGTGATVEEVTDSIGYYRAPHLALGNYEIRVEKPAFKTSTIKGVNVSVGEVTRMDARAGNDPLVVRLDAVLRETIGELLVRDAVGRQIAARAEHAGIESRLGHYALEDSAAEGSAGWPAAGLALPAPCAS